MSEPATPVLETPATPWRRMDPTDLAWCGVEYHWVHRGLELPTIEELRHAVRVGLQQRSPFLRARDTERGLERDLAAHEWDEAAARMVVPATEADARFDIVPERRGLDPWRIAVGEDWLGIDVSHVTADAWTFLGGMDWLYRQARSEAPVEWPWVEPSTRERDLWFARQVLRQPGTVWDAARRRRELAGGEYAPMADTVGDLPAQTAAEVTDTDFPGRVKALRKDHFPGASMTALLTVAGRKALMAELPEPVPGVEMIYSVRARDEVSQRAYGNWSAGVFLHPADDLDPLAVGAAITQCREAGLPVLSAAAARLRRRPATGPRQMVAPTGHPRLASTLVGRGTGADNFPLRSGAVPMLNIATMPNGRHTITLNAVELYGRVHFSWNWYEPEWSEPIRRALARLMADPEDVLLGKPRVG